MCRWPIWTRTIGCREGEERMCICGTYTKGINRCWHNFWSIAT